MSFEPGSPLPERPHGLPPAIEPHPSPLWPEHLVDLFLRPRRFFGSQLAMGRTPYLVVVTWCYGMSDALEGIEDSMLRAELGRPRAGWEQLAPPVTESWPAVWLWLLLSGALGGLFLYWVGGWWYRVRIGWSGAPSPDRHLARLVLVYSSFVFAAPTLAALLAMTVVYPDYATAWRSREAWSLVLLVFPFWSVATSYIGVRTTFPVIPWRAFVWFALLPTLIYVVAFGAVGALLGTGGVSP